MKKIISIILVLTFAIAALAMTASAAMSASFTGPSTVRAGDSITLTFALNGSGIEGASGTLSYDSNQLTLSGTKQSIGNPWAVEFSGNNMVAYDNDLSKPINKSTNLFTVSFKVKSSVAVGTTITVSFTDVRISDGKNETNAGTVSYSAKTAAPLSGDCKLKSLTVSNATISPTFSADVTEYTANVPFEVSKLDVKANANDSSAKVTVDSPELKVNGTTSVTITVKAASGATKTYTIKVTRAQDPNYKASTEAGLTNIKIADFFISPEFSDDRTEYVVYLPYETTSLNITASNKDSKGSFKVEGNTDLKVGDNVIKVIGVAEDGTTEKVYTVVAKRAADPNADPTDTSADDTTAAPDDTTTSDGTTKSDETAEPDVTSNDSDTTSKDNEESNGGMNPLLLIPAILVALVIGFIIGKATNKKK